MADKMLRVAARGTNGVAKPLSLSHNGVLKTSVPQTKKYLGELEVKTESCTEIYSLEQLLAVQTQNAKVTNNTIALDAGLGACIAVNGAGEIFYNVGTVLYKLGDNGDVLDFKDFAATDVHSIAHIYVHDADIYVNTLDDSVPGNEAVNGKLIKLNNALEIVWSVSISDGTKFGAIKSMSISGAEIAIVQRGNLVIIRSTGNGTIIRDYSSLFTSPTAIYHDGTDFYVGDSVGVRKISRATHAIVWTYTTNTPLFAILKHKGAIIAQHSFGVAKLDVTTGAETARLDVSGMVASKPYFVMQHAVYYSKGKHFIKVDLDTMAIAYDFSDVTEFNSLVERDGYLHAIDQTGVIRKFAPDLSQKAIKNVKPVAALVNKPLNRDKNLKIYRTYNGYAVMCMLHDHYLVMHDLGAAGYKFYVLAGGWDAKPQEITLPAAPSWVNFVEYKISDSKTVYRLVLCGGDGKMYHNYADANVSQIVTWAESSVWSLPSMPHPTDKVTKTMYNGRERYKYYVPPTATDAFYYMGGMQHMRVPTDYDANYRYQDSLWFGTYSQTATPMSVFMTKNGQDIYCEYMYGVNRAVSRIGQDINLSAISDAIPGDLKLRKVIPIIPNATNKDPEDVFAFGTDVAVTNISYASGKTTVTAAGHGLASGDVIHFSSASVTDNTDNWLAPTTYASILNNNVSTAWTSKTGVPMGNGKIYQVKLIDANSFTLHEAVGNPHNPLYCTHIHSMDVVPNGIVVSTGEAGELSNITFLASDNTFNTGVLSYLPATKQRVFADYAQLHLTANPVESIEGAIQRPLGFYFEEDYFLFASDENVYQRYVELGEGRAERMAFSSSGVYKGKPSEMDDWSKIKPVLQLQYVAFLFKRIGDLFIVCDVAGNTYYSTDKGDTWHTLYQFDKNIYVPNGASKDGREFVIDGHYFVRE